MELKLIDNVSNFKKKFLKQFIKTRINNPSLNTFLYEVSISKNLFVVGGYLRSVANDEVPRDLDLIINLTSKELQALIETVCKEFTRNRLGGYKLYFEELIVDVWSIEDNWAFKQKLIKNTDSKHVDKIAEGTFYNYDSLVLDVHSLQCNFKHYNSCVKNNKLDIIKRSSNYKKQNPTREANVLRALFLIGKYNLKLTPELKKYLTDQLDYLKAKDGNEMEKLLFTLNKYQKYKDYLSEDIIKNLTKEIYSYSFVSKDNFNINQLNLFE